jgi:hypothetical protein
MSGHTPVPWRQQGELTIDPTGGTRTMAYEIYRDGGPFGHPATCDLLADAEFIVRAANAHEALLRSICGLLEWVLNDNPGGIADSALASWVDSARAAIAEAEGR